jgi:hypothetical protein
MRRECDKNSEWYGAYKSLDHPLTLRRGLDWEWAWKAGPQSEESHHYFIGFLAERIETKTEEYMYLKIPRGLPSKFCPPEGCSISP